MGFTETSGSIPSFLPSYPFLRNQEKKADGRPKKMWSDWISLGKVFPCSVPQTNGKTKLLALNIYPLVLVSFLGRTIARCRSLTTPLASKLHLALSTLGVGSFSIFDRRESPPWIDSPSVAFSGRSKVGKGRWMNRLALWNLSPQHLFLNKFHQTNLGISAIFSSSYTQDPLAGRFCCISICGKEAAYLICNATTCIEQALLCRLEALTPALMFSTARGNNDNTLLS